MSISVKRLKNSLLFVHYIEIKHLIRDIAAPGGGATLFEAEVVESKDTECTIKYQGLQHKNVRLVCGFSQSLTTIIVKPAVGSTV